MTNTFDDTFGGPDLFDQYSADLGQSSNRERPRDKWPVLKFVVGSSGSEEVSVRVLPMSAKTRGHWVKTRNNKSFWADCAAYDSRTDTANGICPYCSLTEPITTNMINWVIDMNSYNWLMGMGYTPDKWAAPLPGTMPAPNQPLMHPFRFLSFSKSMISQVQTIKPKRGGIPASDLNQGYILDIIKKNNNNKVEYQCIPGNTFPIGDDIKAAYQRCQLPDIYEWHCPEGPADTIKSLFFNAKINREQAVNMLNKYVTELGTVTEEAKQSAIKAMDSYLQKHQGDVSAPALPPPTGMGFQSPLAPPQMSSVPLPAAPGMPPAPMMPGMPPPPPGNPMMPPANPMMPSMPQTGMPGMPPAPSMPTPMAAPAMAAPMIPAPPAPMIPTPPAPQMPQMPKPPMAPSMPTMSAPQTPSLPPSGTFVPPSIPSAPPVMGNTGILE